MKKRLKDFFSESIQTKSGEEVSTFEVKKILTEIKCFDTADGLRILHQVASGMAAAHEKLFISTSDGSVLCLTGT